MSVTLESFFFFSIGIKLIFLSATILHKPVEDEFTEYDFLVPGEIPPEAGDEGDEDPCIPVRVLSDFTIFDEDTMELVPVGQLLHLDYADASYIASGLVKPWVDPDSDDEDGSDNDSPVYEADDRLRCSPILEISIHDLIEGEKRLDG